MRFGSLDNRILWLAAGQPAGWLLLLACSRRWPGKGRQRSAGTTGPETSTAIAYSLTVILFYTGALWTTQHCGLPQTYVPQLQPDNDQAVARGETVANVHSHMVCNRAMAS